ncbi:nucleus accumbens-associated protein 2 [Osmerus mordax]|uniref:nucleus accumbens-associated protein 2 n=1 Tax=Osmerus mordax TaxID=8014 RepID=UPI00350EE265
MMSQLLHMEIPNFGSSVLGSLNEQRLLGQYCDVAILVNGQAFKAHRAVLAASSLYFRDLFSSNSQSLFELPSSVTPTCFQQILSFCYTGRLSMAPCEQLVLMYTAGYLQIQNIVERGMELMLKTSSPHCDSQTTSADDLGLDAQPCSPSHRPSGLGSAEALLACGRIKQERCDTPLEGEQKEHGGGPGAEGGGSQRAESRGSEGNATRSSALCYSGVVPGLQAYPAASGERSSPGGSSLPATDSPGSHPLEEEFEEDFYGSSTPGIFGQIYGHPPNPYSMQEKVEMLSLPLATERRPCVLIGRDTMALPASLISQIGYRCHPTLYTEGDPGEKVELVGGSGVYMTRGQLMNCHLCAGIKHKVLLRRLLATFFDRNTLANSCGTGIRSSTNDPSRKPLDNRVLNTVKLYCQNFAPNFKESEMNVIAADMCTNARRVRKRWLPKIQSLLPDKSHRRGQTKTGGSPALAPAPAQTSALSALDLDPRHLSQAYLPLDAHLYAERREALLPHLQFLSSRGAHEGADPEREGVVQAGHGTEAHLAEALPASSPSPHRGSSPHLTEQQEGEETGEETMEEPQEDSQ